MTAPALRLRFPHVTAAALERELARELEQRRRAVAAGRLLPVDLAVAEAWLADAARIRACWLDHPGTAPAASLLPLAWKDRRNGVLRELDRRYRGYPEQVAVGRLTRADAAHRLQCLECLLALYEDGWDWRGSDGLTPLHSATADAEFTALQADRAAREGTAQNEMELT